MNADKHMWRQGYNKSDQVMARALMTPDELRRLDNDKCIILEKGIKPIKADKYYYFKYNTNNLVQKFAVSHNDIAKIDRGIWRKYNPYNPYVEDKQEEETKIESLDDLFEEDNSNSMPNSEPKEQIKAETSVKTEVKKETQEVYDIQKELEDKFDELFGSFDDNNNSTN